VTGASFTSSGHPAESMGMSVLTGGVTATPAMTVAKSISGSL
jgi:hypothetical protein